MKRAALLLCLAGLLAGCGSDDSSGPATLPPVSAPSTAAPTPTTAAPTPVPKPPEADAFTSEGAAAFVRYYVDVINDALHSNNPAALVALSSPGCSGCTKYINSVRSAALQQATVRTDGLHVRSAVAPAISAGETTVLLDFDADGFSAIDPAGEMIERGEPQKGLSAELRCLHSDAGWLVLGFRLVQGST